MKFLLTRPSRGATGLILSYLLKQKISTHTPLAGRDSIMVFLLTFESISTHTPLAGRDARDLKQLGCRIYFYSHAPRGARHIVDRAVVKSVDFYSHAPRGARLEQDRAPDVVSPFLLTRPSRGATKSTK